MDEMANHSWLTDDILDRSFGLAHYLFPHRPYAIQIVLQAVGALDVAAQRQVKRLKYPNHRQRTKVMMDDLHLVQRLILIQADWYQRLQEASDQPVAPTPADMRVRWVHQVVLLSADNSFHATVGQCCVLRSYQAQDARTIYEFLIQSADSSKEDDQFRRWKCRLDERLVARFEGRVMVETLRQGGKRPILQAATDPADIGLTEMTLARLVPWGIEAPHLPAGFRPDREGAEWLKGDPDDSALEMRRIATLLSPAVLATVMHGFRMPNPASQLMCPEFVIPMNNNDKNTEREPRRPLLPEERSAMRGLMDKQSKKRARMDPQELRVRVDGLDVASGSAEPSSSIRLNLPEGASILEVFGKEGAGTALLAVVLLKRDSNDQIIADELEVPLGRSRRIILLVSSCTATVTLERPATIKESLNATIKKALTLRDVPIRAPAYRLQFSPDRPIEDRGMPCPSCAQPLDYSPYSNDPGRVLLRCKNRSCGFLSMQD